MLWGPSDQGLASSVVESSRGAAYLMPATKISSMIAYATRARLFISGDTGPMHLASALNVPIVGVLVPLIRIAMVLLDVRMRLYRRKCPVGPAIRIVVLVMGMYV